MMSSLMFDCFQPYKYFLAKKKTAEWQQSRDYFAVQPLSTPWNQKSDQTQYSIANAYGLFLFTPKPKGPNKIWNH